MVVEISPLLLPSIRAGSQVASQVASKVVGQVATGAAAATLFQFNSTSISSIDNGGDSSNLPSSGLPPEAKAILLMAISMALHYLSYSLARPTTLALFTSDKTGFTSPSAFPLAMAFISPASLLLLLGYTRHLDTKGPGLTLRNTSLFCASILTLASLVIARLMKAPNATNALKASTALLFIFRESYVQLITSQMWSFMVSVLTPSQSARWTAPICGLTSLASAGAGMGVATVVRKFGLTGALIGAALGLFASAFVSSAAYRVAEKHSFSPEIEHSKSKNLAKKEGEVEEGMLQKATKLFARVPTLGALFVEVLACQGLSTLLNVCFVTKLKEAIPDDVIRAGWTGKFFALINLISSILQLTALPLLMTRIEPSVLWRTIPSLMCCLTFYQAAQPNPSLRVVSGSLLALKAMEFSARRMLDEMVYVPLDYESRYVGKEVIGVFGYRFGKSSTSLVLSGLTSVFGNFNVHGLSCLTSGMCVVWLGAAVRLSNFVPTRKEAEELYISNKTEEPSEKR